MRLPKLVLVLCALGALFYACKDSGGPTAADPGPADSCLADTTLCAVPIDTTGQDSLPDTTFHPPGPRNCATHPAVFTEYLIDPSLVKGVAQIGSIGGANTELVGRSYIFPKDGQAGQRLPLRAPVAMRLRGSKHYRPDGAPTTGYIPDWSLMFDADCGVSLEFYHVKDVSDSIKKVSDTTVHPSSNWEIVPRRVEFRAGDTIGWYVPAAPGGLAAFDFIVRNDSVVNRFANQARYLAYNSNILHVVCPYDLFVPAKKAAYYDLISSVGGIPYPGAGCGTVSRDSLGTPAGQWWFDSAFTPGSRPLRKEGFYGDPMQVITGPDSTIMIGHTGPNNDIRFQRSNATWKKPETLTTEWCYQVYPTPTTPDGWLWLRMDRADKMSVAYNPTGTCPSTFPAGGFKTYYR
ncbi:MAG: hypothetical protein K0Q91_319 [Fibrobacteria bacterium]|nr:hypothetical protein [Fibrobacteria bacterium]